MREKNNKGFTMIEIILVIAILALLSGVTVGVVSYIRYGNSEKCVAEIDATLDKLQLEAMSKEVTPYMYLYGTDKGYYMILSDSKDLNRVELEAQGGTRLANNALSVLITGMKMEVGGVTIMEAGTKDLKELGFVRLGFKKSTGAFLEGSYCESIAVTGKGITTIYLVEGTGKHYVE